MSLEITRLTEVDLVLASTEINPTFSTCFKNSSNLITKSNIPFSPLTVTCKSTTLLSSDVDSPALVIRTSTLPPPQEEEEDDATSSFSSTLAPFDNSASRTWFFLLSSSTLALREDKCSVVMLRTDALSFCT